MSQFAHEDSIFNYSRSIEDAVHDFDPYDLLMQNTNHIQQLAEAQRRQAKLLETNIQQTQEVINALVNINHTVNDLQHRIIRLERQIDIE